MTDEAAFLAAITERPNDNTLRLAYADWLDENGRPEFAAFLRGEVWLWTQAERPPGWFRHIREFLRAARSTPDDWREAVSRPRLAGTTWRCEEPNGSWAEVVTFLPCGRLLHDEGNPEEIPDAEDDGTWRQFGPRVELVINSFSLHRGTARGDMLPLRGRSITDEDPRLIWVWTVTRVLGPDCLPNLP